MGGVTLIVLEPLANASVSLGLFDQALKVSDEALALGKSIGDHQAEAELHRLKGEALLGAGNARPDQAAACFEKALSISRKQKAKSLELRAAMSMARLWQAQGKRDEARILLAGIHDWFTEGMNTPDLRSAEALLEALTEPAKN
jgi:predicted ATPase